MTKKKSEQEPMNAFDAMLKKHGLKKREIKFDRKAAEDKERKQVAAYERAVSKEAKRVKVLPCPSCKKTKKKHEIQSQSNGIIGPGYHSRILMECYVCQNCGTMFKDLHKKTIERPRTMFI